MTSREMIHFDKMKLEIPFSGMVDDWSTGMEIVAASQPRHRWEHWRVKCYLCFQIYSAHTR